MTRNHSRRQTQRPGVEAVEARLLLSAAPPSSIDDVAIAEAFAAQSSAGLSSTAAVTAQDAIIGASTARVRFGVTGEGLTAAVIDTGVDYNHPAFGGGMGAGKVVVAGHDFGDNDSDPMASTSPHGTAVAGIIASRDPRAPGVAPGAEIAALRVFDASGKASFTRIADALQWVIDNHDRYNISVVNLSISDHKNHEDLRDIISNPANGRMLRLIDRLEAMNIPVVTAAGNSFDGAQGMGYTAIVDNTISVTGSDGNRIASDAQRLGTAVGGASATDLLAPGRAVKAPWEGTSTISLDGTSFAAPQVTGAVLLLQELHLKRFGTLPSIDQLESWLRDSAVKVRDDVTGITIGRLDIPAAAAMVPSPKPPAPSTPPVGNAGQPGGASGNGGASPSSPSTPATNPGTNPAGSPGGSKTGGNGSGTAGSGSSSGGGTKSVTNAPSPSPSTPPRQEATPPADPAPKPAPSPAAQVPAAPSTPPTEPVAAPETPDVAPPAAAPAAPEAPSPVAPEPAPVAEVPAPVVEPGPVVADRPAADPGQAGVEIDTDVIDSTIDLIVLDDEDATHPDAGPASFAEEEADGPGPVVVTTVGGRPSAAAPSRHPGAVFAVRAWSLARPSSPPIWGRAQFLRASRLSNAAQRRSGLAEVARPFPAARLRSDATRWSSL